MKFEWDINKAKTVFFDPLAYIFDDQWHSLGEQRELIIGHSNKKQLLIVSFTEQTEGVIRIISSRLTTTKERKEYEQHRWN